MRFIHTADLHLGAAPDPGFPWAGERAAAVRDSLSSVLAIAEKEGAQLLLIAGDLFHHQPLKSELEEAACLFGQLPDCRVVIIAGNRDYITETSAYPDFKWPENVYFITSPVLSSVYFEDINTEVHGFSYHKREYKEPLLDDLRAPADGRIHILLAHAGDSAHVPLKLTALAGSGFDYIALGHIHQPRVYKNTRIAICGSPEPLDRTEGGGHGCLMGDLTKEDLDLTWRTVSATRYREQSFTVTPETTGYALAAAIKGELAAHPSDIYRLTLSGQRDPDFIFDTDAVMALGRIIEVTDMTEPAYDLQALMAEHSGDLIGHYIRALSGAEATPTMKKALYYGLRALLESGLEKRA